MSPPDDRGLFVLFVGGPEDGRMLAGDEARAMTRWRVVDEPDAGEGTTRSVEVGWRMRRASSRFAEATRLLSPGMTSAGTFEGEAFARLVATYALHSGERALEDHATYEVALIEEGLIVFRFVDEPATEPETAA